MSKEFVVTKEMLKNASSCIPLREKCNLAKEIAESCLVEVDYPASPVGGTFDGLPKMKVENMELRQLLLMNVFLTGYLNITFDTPMTVEDYDRYESSGVIQQIENFRSDPALRNKANSIIYDFRDFKKILDTEIYNAKMVNNDMATRLLASVANTAVSETVKYILDEAKKQPPDGQKTPVAVEEVVGND